MRFRLLCGFLIFGFLLTAEVIRAQMCNYGLRFDGIDDYVESTYATALGNTYTVEFWAKIEGDHGTLFHRGWSPYCYYEPDIYILNDNSELTLNVQVSGCQKVQRFGILPVSNDVWYHVAVVVNGTSQTFIVNGNVVAIGNKNPYSFVTGYHWVGAVISSYVPQEQHFEGIIDEVRIWDSIRSVSEIQATMNDTLGRVYYENPASGLICYWRFDGDADDLTNQQNHGIIHGAQFVLISGAGTISGAVSASSSGLAGVTVKLLDDADPTIIVDEQTTDSQGNFSFLDAPARSYQVMIVEPLGYAVSQNFIHTDLACGATNTVDFGLTEIVLVNNARSKGYWKHQFDVYVNGKGHAQESESVLQSYLNEVINRYNSHFNIFMAATDGVDDFDDWQAILSVKGNAGMEAKTTSQLAALLLNMSSLKIAQYEEVTADGKTAGDVLTFVSYMLVDTDPSNDELAKDLAEKVNVQQTIEAGVVPTGNILYKGGEESSSINWRFGIPREYALHQNYPNPFNPTTTIRFALPKAGQVELKIYNVMGQLVRTLISEYMEAGNYAFRWDGNNQIGVKASSGLYVYKIKAGDYIDVKKMILMK